MADLYLETHELTKIYGKFTALRNCSVQVPTGQIFGLLGPNGAGKTTLIRTLLGFLRPTSGWGKIGGLDCAKQSVAVRRLVSYLPGDARLFRHLRGSSILDFFASMQPLGSKQRSVEIAKRLELDLSRRVAFMSTGMRQKLALSAVLGSSAPLIILDEPTANLDPTVRQQVLQLTREVRQSGRTVLFSSHIMSEIEEICDQVVILRRGEVVHRQDVKKLRSRHRICGRHSSAESFAISTIPDHLKDRIRECDDNNFPICWELEGDLSDALGWLAQLNLQDLRIEPVGMQSVYEQFHGQQMTTAEPTGATV